MRNEARVLVDRKGEVLIEIRWKYRFLNYLVRRALVHFGRPYILFQGYFKGAIPTASVEWIAFFRASNGHELLAFRVQENEEWNHDIKTKYIDQLLEGDRDISTPSIRYVGIIKSPEEQKLIKDYLTKIGLAFEVYVVKH